MADVAVSVQNLRKYYGRVAAVDGISFAVARGEIFGLLGPNGAGKTTTLECLEGLLCADSGRLRVLDVDPARDPQRLQRLIGVQLQTGALPGYLTVVELLRLFSGYRGVAPDFTLIERLGLNSQLKTQYNDLSTGQQRRLSLALALVHRPQALFLDEPTAGLDVASRMSLHQLLRELRAQGAAIVLSTHDMAEAETVADRVAILLKGRIAAIGTPRELTATGAGLTRISVRTVGDSLASLTLPMVIKQIQQGEYTVLLTAAPGPTATTVIRHIEQAEDQLIDLRIERPSLEERFLELTQSVVPV